MEGTRHEKIAIILASYVIGFTTAFIAFGLNKLPESEVVVVSNLDFVSGTIAREEAVSAEGITSVGFGKDGLFAITSGYERLLSADRNSFSANVANSLMNTPGFYYDIIDAEASKNGQFVYFCEQLEPDAEYCSPYVYSLNVDTVFPVKVDGEVYKASIAEHKSAWSDDNNLVLNGMTSFDNQTPWIFNTLSEIVNEPVSTPVTDVLPEVQ